MNADTDLEELESKIKLLEADQQNSKFEKCIKDIMAYIDHFDVTTIETKISSKVLPAIQNRFNMIFTDNYSIHETTDDELMGSLIKENLEVILSLTEIVQELLNHICSHSPVKLFSVKSVLKYLPNYIRLFMEHWRSSSETYKSAFIEELTKIFEVMKHLYTKFLYLLECSISVHEDDEISLLTDALILVCEMPQVLCDIDASSLVISSWKCFGTVITKYSSILENHLDVRIPIRLLTEHTCRLMASLDNDMEALRRQLKILTLQRVLFKILMNVFYQQLKNCASELLIFYIRVLSYSLDYYATRNFSREALGAIENDVFQNLDEFLQQLILGQEIMKVHIINLSNTLKALHLYEKYSQGFLNLLNKILQVIAADSSDSDWSEVMMNLTEDVFESLPYCRKDSYEHLIISTSAAILMQDVKYQITNVLLKHILQSNNVFVAVLALEVYSLVASNISSQECLLLLANLLYGLDEELMCGFFTHRPEMVYLKCLLQRLFRILLDADKEQIIELFPVDQYVQIWRFLGLNMIPSNRIPALLEPVLAITTHHIKSINESANEEMPLNIAEGLHLISTIEGLNMADPRFSQLLNFIETFWSLDLTSNTLLENNIMKYFIYKISSLTAKCMTTFCLNPALVFSKLKTLLSNQSYWIPVFKIISSMLNSLVTIEMPSILKEIADIMPLVMKNNMLMQEVYLDHLRGLNECHNDFLNMLLDHLNANTANEIFHYIDKVRKTNVQSIHNVNSNFKHVCLQWKSDAICPPAKRLKYDNPNPNPRKKAPVIAISHHTNNDDEDSSATEIIDRLKGEMKCLIKVCKTEKLTQKNVADLRILMSQMSSLM